MNQNGQDGNGSGNNNNGGNGGSSAGAKVAWGVKVGYIGTGVLIGLIAYPFVRKAISKFQPKVDEMLDGLTGKAEELAEHASDMMAKARDNLVKGKGGEAKAGAHAHPHRNGKSADTTQ